MTEGGVHDGYRAPADLQTVPRPELDALVADIRRSQAADAILLAIARRNAILAGATDLSSGSVQELVALETGTFDSRTARQPGPSRAATSALAALEALGIGPRGPASVHGGHLLEGMQSTLASLLLLRHPRARDAERSGAPSLAGERDAIAIVQQTRALAHRLALRDESDRELIATLGKAATSAHRVHAALELWPIASVAWIIEATGLQVQAVTSALHRLRGLGIVREISRRHRHRLYCYDAWLALLDDDVVRSLDEREDEP